jgi:hypothetical protein
MNSKFLITLCATAALLTACNQRNDQSGTYSQGPNGTGTETPSDKAAAPGDTSTTPGGTAGEAATVPDTTPAETPPPPNDPPPSEPPSNPPQ